MSNKTSGENRAFGSLRGGRDDGDDGSAHADNVCGDSADDGTDGHRIIGARGIGADNSISGSNNRRRNSCCNNSGVDDDACRRDVEQFRLQRGMR